TFRLLSSFFGMSIRKQLERNFHTFFQIYIFIVHNLKQEFFRVFFLSRLNIFLSQVHKCFGKFFFQFNFFFLIGFFHTLCNTVCNMIGETQLNNSLKRTVLLLAKFVVACLLEFLVNTIHSNYRPWIQYSSFWNDSLCKEIASYFYRQFHLGP